jgi:hypothetical protein
VSAESRTQSTRCKLQTGVRPRRERAGRRTGSLTSEG